MRELERYLKHIETKHAHPARGVRLLDVPAHRKRCAPVKNADVIEAQKAALKYIAPVGPPEAAVR